MQVELEHDEVQMVRGLAAVVVAAATGQRRKKLLQSLKFAKGVYFNREAMRFGERSDADGGRKVEWRGD